MHSTDRGIAGAGNRNACCEDNDDLDLHRVTTCPSFALARLSLLRSSPDSTRAAEDEAPRLLLVLGAVSAAALLVGNAAASWPARPRPPPKSRKPAATWAGTGPPRT